MQTIQDQIAAVIARHPTLNQFGFGASDAHKLTTEERCRKITEGQAALMSKPQEVAFVVEWLSDVEKTKSINPSAGSSYGLKHLAEEDSPEGYITNGAFIVGAIIAGFEVGQIDGPNCHFNMSAKSIERKRQAQKS